MAETGWDLPKRTILPEERRMSSQDATVVLVHGAWADGSSWSKVIGLLQAEGAKVLAAPLPPTSLADDTDRMIASETQRFMAERMKARAQSHPVDHAPIVTAPRVVAEMIRDAVRDATPKGETP
jgi:hypothetical protein